MLDSLEEGFFARDAAGRYTFMNAYAQAWLGVGREAIGRTHMELFPRGLASRVEDTLRTMQGHAAIDRLECASHHHPGRWIEIRSHRAGDGCCYFFRDITCRKAAALDAAQVGPWLQAMVDVLPSRVALVSQQGRVVAANTTWLGAGTPFGARVGGHQIGANYLHACQQSGETCERSRIAAGALSDVLCSRAAEFYAELGCARDSAAGGGRLHISRCEMNGGVYAVVIWDDTSRFAHQKHAPRLSAHAIRAQTEERCRIAQELHDSTAQKLLCAKLAIESARRRIAPDDEQGHLALAEALAFVSESQTEIRSLSYRLHPPSVTDGGLVTAVARYAAGLARRITMQIHVNATVEAESLSLPPHVATSLFRLVQEALTNAHRHSGSTCARVSLRLTWLRGREYIRVVVEDEGRGVDPDQVTPGVGLASMTQRVGHMGGWLEFRRRHPCGTAVVATIPIERPGAERRRATADTAGQAPGPRRRKGSVIVSRSGRSPPRPSNTSP